MRQMIPHPSCFGSPHRFRQSGFSMAEALITLVIIGIATAMAAPSFQEMYDNYRLRKASIDFMNALTFAKSEAVRRGQQINVDAIGGNWQNGWIVNIAPATILQTFDPLTNITLTKASSGTIGQISFGSNGTRTDFPVKNAISFDARFCDRRNRGRDISVRITGASNLREVTCP